MSSMSPEQLRELTAKVASEASRERDRTIRHGVRERRFWGYVWDRHRQSNDQRHQEKKESEPSRFAP